MLMANDALFILDRIRIIWPNAELDKWYADY